MNSLNNHDSTVLFKRQTSLPQSRVLEREVDPYYQNIKLTESYKFYTPESNKYQPNKDNSLFNSLNSFEKESYFSSDQFKKSTDNHLGKYKDVSLKSTIDGGSSITYDDHLSLSQSSFENECQFSFGFKQQTVTTSSSNLSSKLFKRTSTKISSNTKRESHRLQKNQITQFQKSNNHLLKSQKQVSLINQITKFLCYNIRNLSGLTYQQTNKCLETLGFNHIISKYNNWQKLVTYQLNSLQKQNIPISIFMFSLFKILHFNFQQFQVYFWMLVQLRACQAEMYYQQIIQLPLITNGKQKLQISNNSIFIPSNSTNFLSINEVQQIYSILTPKTSINKKSMIKNINSEKISSPITLPSIQNICQKQQDIYKVNVNINSLGISIQFDLFQQDNLQEIVDELSQDYSLPPFVKNQFLEQLKKSFSQI